MKIPLFITALILMLSCSSAQENSMRDPESCLPRTEKSSQIVDCISTDNMSTSERLMLMSLQGLVNREEAVIYTYNHRDRWILEFYVDKGYITDINEFDDVWELLEKYRDHCSKAVLCDPEKFYSVNLATNIAGVEDRIVLTEETKEKFSGIIGCDDIMQLSELKLNTPAETFRWYRENIYPQQNNMMLGLSKGGHDIHDVFLDYLISFRLPTFWLPGKEDRDYDADYDAEVLDFIKKTPRNIPVLGFWYSVENGKVIGYNEFPGVKEAGKYGKFTLVNDIVGNYTYHTGVDTGAEELKQKHSADKIKYDPEKKYVALIMVESGDAPCYFHYDQAFYERQWNQAERGQVAINYGLSPALRYLSPALLKHIYDTQTENDYFFCSISGMGYCYPFEGYGSGTEDPDACLHEYYCDLTSHNMKKMDLDILAIYTHPGPEKWSEDNMRIAQEHIAKIEGLRALTAGMHRTGYTGSEANFTIGEDITVFNTVTHWDSNGGFAWNDMSLDEKAAAHIINEIRKYGAESHFIQAMFYSWDYGPRRLLKVKESLEKEGYVFVTLEQMDFLYRESNK